MTTRLLINMVVVVMLGVVMVAWVIANIIGTGFFNQPFVVSADFESSGGVFTNQEVTYRGVLIGQVGDLTLNRDGVDVELLIDKEWAGKIPASVTAEVQSKSAVGEQFVNLTPTETASTEMLADGDEITRDRTSLPVDFQELLTSLDSVLRDVPPGRVRNLTHNLADGLGGRSEDLASILESLGTLSRAFAEVAPEQQRLLSNATETGRAFLATKDEFAAAIAASDEVFAGLGDEPEELSALFKANDAFAREGSALLARQGDNLAGGIDALADFVDYQYTHLADVEQSLVHLPQFLHAIEDASIPWQSPDGRKFYRIRIGYVYDNVRSTWPCKYRLPDGYERFQFERAEREPVTTMSCLRTPADDSTALVRSLVAALREWSKGHPEETAAMAVELQESLDDFTSAPEVPEPLVHLFDGIDYEPVPSPTPSATPSPTPTP